METEIARDALIFLGMLLVRFALPLTILAVVGRWIEHRLAEKEVVTEAAPNPRVLVVDDDPDFVNLTSTILRSQNYDVIAASDGRQAMQVMRRAKPDVTLLDVMMTHLLEGLEVAREMAQDPVLKDIPVIMITSLAGSRARSVLPPNEHVPMEKWIQKPIDPDLLLAEVAAALGRAPALALA